MPGHFVRGASSGWELVADAGESGRDESAHRAGRFDDAKAKRVVRGAGHDGDVRERAYVWKADGAKSHADPDGPPVASFFTGVRN